MKHNHRLVSLAATLALLCAGGCGSGPRLFVSSQADMTFYKKVAVLSFANFTAEPYAGDRVTRAFVTELIIADRFELVDPGEFRTVLSQIGAEPNTQGNYDPEKVKTAAAKVGATGIIRGGVTEFQRLSSAQDEVPVLAFDVEMVDVNSNSVVWRVSENRKGKGRFPLVGGASTRSFGMLMQDACEDVVHQLQKKAF